MSGIASRWPVAQYHRIEAADVDETGIVRAEVLDRWISDACTAYLDRCEVLRALQSRSGLTVKTQMNVVPVAATLGRPESVVVSAGATELRPTSFTIAVRIRSMGDDGAGVLNLACEVGLQDQAGARCDVGEDVRDELIALAHAASHFNERFAARASPGCGTFPPANGEVLAFSTL